jgi:cell division protein FtsB
VKTSNKKYRITKILTSKYILTGAAFVIWMLFFDRNDVSLQMRRINELHKLQESEQMMTTMISETKKELELLRTNPATLEKYAREKYMMKKENEDLYIISYDSSLIR